MREVKKCPHIFSSKLHIFLTLKQKGHNFEKVSSSMQEFSFIYPKSRVMGGG